MTITLPNTIIKHFVGTSEYPSGFYLYQRDESGIFARLLRVPDGTLGDDNTFEIDSSTAEHVRYDGRGGSDTYVIRSSLNKNIGIQDTDFGDDIKNRIVFDSDVMVKSIAQVAEGSDIARIRLTLNTGAVITVYGPDAFVYVVGDAAALDFAKFINTYGDSGITPTTAQANRAPVFGDVPTDLSIDENADGSSVSVSVGHVTASDADAGDTLTYSILRAVDQNGDSVTGFEVDGTGLITYIGTGFSTELDAAAITSVTLTVSADDGEDHVETPVIIEVTDADESQAISGPAVTGAQQSNAGPGNNANNPPTSFIAINARDKNPTTLTHNNIKFTGDDLIENPANIIYTMTDAPEGATLARIGAELTMGQTFSHQDVLNGWVSLALTGESDPSGPMFTITDGTDSNPVEVTLAINVRGEASVTTASDTIKDSANGVDYRSNTGSLIIDTGDGNDQITAARGSDFITAGLGDDTINLDVDAGDADSSGQDTVVYNFASGTTFTATDGGDKITRFRRGEDVFLLQTESDDPALARLDGFLSHVGGTDKSTSDDDLLIVQPNFEYEPDGHGGHTFLLEGVTFHFQDAGTYAGGRLAQGFVEIKFDESLSWEEFLSLIEIDNGDGTRDENFNYGRGIIKDLSVLPDLFGEGSLAYAPSTPITLGGAVVSVAETPSGTHTSRTEISYLVLTDDDGGTLELAETGDYEKFQLDGNVLYLRAGKTISGDISGDTLNVRVVLSGDNPNNVGIDIAVPVTDANEIGPAIISDAMGVALTEGVLVSSGTAVYMAVGTTDLSGSSIAWSLEEGVGDDTLFVIDRDSGAVTFRAAETTPDHETKGAYSFTVVAADSGRTAKLAVSIAITNVDEGSASFNITSNHDIDTPAVTDILTVVVDTNDPDGNGADGFDYRWQRNGRPIDDAINASYTIEGDDEGTTLSVVVSYTDGGGTGEVVPVDGVAVPVPDIAPAGVVGTIRDTSATYHTNSPRASLGDGPLVETPELTGEFTSPGSNLVWSVDDGALQGTSLANFSPSEFGTFSFDNAATSTSATDTLAAGESHDGAWTFTLHPNAVGINKLNERSVSLIYTVTVTNPSTNSSDTETLELRLTGMNDRPILSSPDLEFTVTSYDPTNTIDDTTARGIFITEDPDDGQAITAEGGNTFSGNDFYGQYVDIDGTALGSFVRSDDAGEGAMIVGTYGNLFLKNDGTWKYVLENERAATINLAFGDEVKDIFRIHLDNVDGTKRSSNKVLIDITVIGGEPPPFVVPDIIVYGSDRYDRNSTAISGTDDAELFQGGAGNDEISTGGATGGEDVVIGGAGHDDITLGSGPQIIVYRYDSSGRNGKSVAIDGDDVINDFRRGVDKLILVDVNEDAPITNLDDFFSHAGKPEITISFNFNGLDSLIDGVVIGFDAPGADGTRNSFGGPALKINFNVADRPRFGEFFSSLSGLMLNGNDVGKYSRFDDLLGSSGSFAALEVVSEDALPVDVLDLDSASLLVLRNDVATPAYIFRSISGQIEAERGGVLVTSDLDYGVGLTEEVARANIDRTSHSIRLRDSPPHGSLVLEDDGSWTYEIVGSRFNHNSNLETSGDGIHNHGDNKVVTVWFAVEDGVTGLVFTQSAEISLRGATVIESGGNNEPLAEGTANDEFFVGRTGSGGVRDTIKTGEGSNGVYAAGGADTIHLGMSSTVPTEQNDVVYHRFSSHLDRNFKDVDGNDVIHNFVRNQDEFVLVDWRNRPRFDSDDTDHPDPFEEVEILAESSTFYINAIVAQTEGAYTLTGFTMGFTSHSGRFITINYHEDHQVLLDTDAALEKYGLIATDDGNGNDVIHSGQQAMGRGDVTYEEALHNYFGDLNDNSFQVIGGMDDYLPEAINDFA